MTGSRIASTRNLLRLSTVVILIAALLGCRGSGGSPPESQVAPRLVIPASAMGRSPHINSSRLIALEAQVQGEPAPEGISAADWDSLRAAFIELLRLRSVQALPNPNRNVITDMQVVDDGAGGWNLVWSYRNTGDYNLDGEVSISDLTALGKNLGKRDGQPGWEVSRAADGDGNGEVNITDITPIGANLFSQVNGYHIYGGDSEDGPWEMLGTIARSKAGGSPPRFTYTLGLATRNFYTISPYDMGGADWIIADGLENPAHVFGTFNNALLDFNQATFDYVKAYNDTVTVNADAVNAQELTALVENFLDKSQAWLDGAASFNEAQELLNSMNSSASTLRMVSDGPCDYVPGLSTGTGIGSLKDVGDLMSKTRKAAEDLKKQFPEWDQEGSADQMLYHRELAKLPKEMVSTGAGIVMGGGAGVLGSVVGYQAGAIAMNMGYFAGFSKLLVCTGTAATGGVLVGVGFCIWYSYYRSSSNNGSGVDKLGSAEGPEGMLFWAGSSGNGEGIPMCLPPGGTLVVAVDGYAPFIFDNFNPGETDQIELDLTFASQTSTNPLAEMVCSRTDSPAFGLDCLDIQAVTAFNVPADPAPSQSVAVTATVMPRVAGCPVSYSVAGTDGYSASGSPLSDASGQITFSIPGGAEGVFDSVTITANGKTYSISYTF